MGILPSSSLRFVRCVTLSFFSLYVPSLQPSTEDRVAAMQFGHEPLRGLTLEEDEERLMRIAIRESAAESKRGERSGHLRV